MSYIPDCRRDEYYNQKYLTEKDAEFIRGFDWCAENAMDVFFDNIKDFFGTDSFLMHILSQEIPEDEHDEYIQITFNGHEEKRTVKTYLDAIRAHLIDYVESNRDDLITSMIDNMDEDEYNSIKEKVDNGGESE